MRYLVPVAGALSVGLALLSGCSAPQDAEPEERKPRASKAAERVPEPLTSAELKALTFKDGEVPQASEGGMEVTEFAAEEGESEFPPVSDPYCQFVNEIRSGESASAGVSQLFNWKDDIFAGDSVIAAYPAGRAESEFDRLREALDRCESYEGESYGGDYRARIEEKSTAGFGDEAVTFLEMIPMDHPKDPRERVSQFTVVRVGDVIATFLRYDLGHTTPFPADLIKKQVERLAEAQEQRVR
ncbi:hypothetical protein [Streptomyces sp. NPDC004134]|uniref:hypothetical protein n=1 Tax=Streptomyces sp. NPDC004134 TaxID=3364691 RepID=UPI00367E475A